MRCPRRPWIKLGVERNTAILGRTDRLTDGAAGAGVTGVGAVAEVAVVGRVRLVRIDTRPIVLTRRQGHALVHV